MISVVFSADAYSWVGKHSPVHSSRRLSQSHSLIMSVAPLAWLCPCQCQQVNDIFRQCIIINLSGCQIPSLHKCENSGQNWKSSGHLPYHYSCRLHTSKLSNWRKKLQSYGEGDTSIITTHYWSSGVQSEYYRAHEHMFPFSVPIFVVSLSGHWCRWFVLRPSRTIACTGSITFCQQKCKLFIT